MRRFAIRTIKDGQVKIQGKVFAPSGQHMKYDGRLDGLRYVFGLYYSPSKELAFTSLWGSGYFYKTGKRGKELEIVDGTLPWVWWNEVREND